MITRVTLIRHGQSLANAGHVTSDPATIPLTERGWVQATQVAARLERAPSLIVTSSYLRTQQTAQPTLDRFPQAERDVWPVHEFTYISPENCVNMTASQRRPLVQTYWTRCDPHFVDGPGAESFAAMSCRAEGTLLQLQQAGHSEVAIFTHGQFMQMLLWLVQHPAATWSRSSMQAWRAWMLAAPIENTATVQLVYSSTEGWMMQPHLVAA